MSYTTLFPIVVSLVLLPPSSSCVLPWACEGVRFFLSLTAGGLRLDDVRLVVIDYAFHDSKKRNIFGVVGLLFFPLKLSA